MCRAAQRIDLYRDRPRLSALGGSAVGVEFCYPAVHPRRPRQLGVQIVAALNPPPGLGLSGIGSGCLDAVVADSVG